jgi:membrane protease subunit HflC
MKTRTVYVVCVAALLVALACSSFYVVGEADHAIVVRFGRPVRTISTAGLGPKWPFPVDRVVRFDRRLMLLDLPAADEAPREFLTLDKKNVEVASYACWRITDPLRFYEAVGDARGGEIYLADIIIAELGTALGGQDLGAIVSTDRDDAHFDAIQSSIREKCAQAVSAKAGIELVDFRIKRVTFPEQNRNSVFERMRAERKQIATLYRSEGEQEAAKIRAEADLRRDTILAEAKRQALETQGKADADAASIYNQAYAQDPEFYEFLRTLESYEKTLTSRATIILPRSMAYLNTLLNPPRVERETAPPSESTEPLAAGVSNPAEKKPAESDDH